MYNSKNRDWSMFPITSVAMGTFLYRATWAKSKVLQEQPGTRAVFSFYIVTLQTVKYSSFLTLHYFCLSLALTLKTIVHGLETKGRNLTT